MIKTKFWPEISGNCLIKRSERPVTCHTAPAEPGLAFGHPFDKPRLESGPHSVTASVTKQHSLAIGGGFCTFSCCLGIAVLNQL